MVLGFCLGIWSLVFAVLNFGVLEHRFFLRLGFGVSFLGYGVLSLRF